MTNKRIFLVLFILIALAAVMLFSQNVKKVSTFGYKGEYNSVKLIVDTEIARLRFNEPYIPLFVHLGHSEKKVIKASRGSFTLLNPDGKSVLLPSYEEVVKNYGANLLSNDYTYLEKINDYASMDFMSCERISKVTFYPNPSSRSILYDTVEMPNRSYFSSLLYFPNNSEKKDGTYTLIFEDKESGIKIEVPFEIKWMKK
jgi:hypothetical protein